MLRRFAQPRSRPNRATDISARLKVDGRLFTCNHERIRLRGVTYGPFAPNLQGDPFPSAAQALEDLVQLSDLGFNALRVYHVPPEWLIDLVSSQGTLGVIVDVPWS